MAEDKVERIFRNIEAAIKIIQELYGAARAIYAISRLFGNTYIDLEVEIQEHISVIEEETRAVGDLIEMLAARAGYME